MDVGKSSNDDLSSVQLNQAASNAAPDSPATSPPLTPNPSASAEPAIPTDPVPIRPDPVPPPLDSEPPPINTPSPAVSPLTNPTPPAMPQAPQAPTPAPKPDFGVGQHDIGVELDDPKPTPAEPPVSPSEAPETPKPMQTDSSVNVKAIGAPTASNTPPSYNIPINKYSDKVSDTPQAPGAANAVPLNPNLANITAPGSPPIAPKPPVKAPSSAAGTITALAILALLVGGCGGFLGFKYLDRIKTSASTVEPSSAATIGQTATSEKDKTYSSTKYGFSLTYPSTWFTSTSDKHADQTDEITLASNQESLAGKATGYKISLVFQDSNGKELKDWVEANSATTNEKKTAKAITVDKVTAYQQELSGNGPAVATYLKIQEKIMILTYTAPIDKMSEGGDLYNQIINSIKLS